LARRGVDAEGDVAYGIVDGELLLLDVYRPPGRAAPRPAMVLIHGGGMWTGSRADMADPARRLARAGYVAFAVDYRLVDAATARHRWPAQLDDVQLALRWVRASAGRYGVDPERVGAYGWSAGGQLAALLGARDTRDLALANADRSSRVACVIDLAGDVDLTAYTLPPALDEVVALLGGTPAEVPARYRDVSPLSWIDPRTAPFLVIHGLRDDVVPIEQLRRLVSALRAAGVEVEYTELPGAGHGDLTWSRVGPAALTFLGRHLRPGDRGRGAAGPVTSGIRDWQVSRRCPKMSAMFRTTGYCCACPERVQDLPHARVLPRRAASIA
jgi:acetyl esterase/lipase